MRDAGHMDGMRGEGDVHYDADNGGDSRCHCPEDLSCLDGGQTAYLWHGVQFASSRGLKGESQDVHRHDDTRWDEDRVGQQIRNVEMGE